MHLTEQGHRQNTTYLSAVNKTVISFVSPHISPWKLDTLRGDFQTQEHTKLYLSLHHLDAEATFIVVNSFSSPVSVSWVPGNGIGCFRNIPTDI